MVKYTIDLSREFTEYRAGRIGLVQLSKGVFNAFSALTGYVGDAESSLQMILENFKSMTFSEAVSPREFTAAWDDLMRWCGRPCGKGVTLCHVRTSPSQEIPRIDDCDFLLAASTRCGRDMLYLRLTELSVGGPYDGVVTTDFDTIKTVSNIGSRLSFKSMRRAAEHLRSLAREVFGPRRFSLCGTARKALRSGHGQSVSEIESAVLSKISKRASARSISFSPTEAKILAAHIEAQDRKIALLERACSIANLCLDCGEPTGVGCKCGSGPDETELEKSDD